MRSLRNTGAYCLGLLIIISLFSYFLSGRKQSSISNIDPTLCAGPPLKNVEARNKAMEDGYIINRKYDCIDKSSYDQVQKEKLAWQKAQWERKKAKPQEQEAWSGQTLGESRKEFKTAVSGTGTRNRIPLPQPPANLFVRSDYLNAQDLKLAAFVTPDPKDGQKHPAIIWLTGGDSSSLEDFWVPGPPTNDQSASAFRNAGMIMMFPTLRGGNENPGNKEYFFGEIDDVLAAADHLSRLPYVDARQIYLGGHSTGGTLALLTAETKGRFRAVFAFGPAARVDHYPPAILPVDFSRYDTHELKLRSPIFWLHGIASPTYVIEGEMGNRSDLKEICRTSKNPLLHCITVKAANHFDVLDKTTRIIAAYLVKNPADTGLTQQLSELGIKSD